MTAYKWCVGIFVIITVGLFGCDKKESSHLFELLPSSWTNIHFANTIAETDSFNIFTYDYIYNGGGVAVADFNNDGLQDIFFTGNQVENKLYLNEGDFKFKDITDKANVNTSNRWNCGVVVVDINNDGWQDIYVCSTMKADSVLRENSLYLNKGVDNNNVPVFEEVAAKYGINDNGYSLMASFFDYDLDGDLDLYVLTNMHSSTVSSNYRTKILDGSSPTTDRFYRNNGDGTFTNVSREAGILIEGFGLGLAIADYNNDGWPDIYVSNDFITNDVLYINNHNGTFTNQSSHWIAHQSHSSMGSDAADFNNDGLVDIVTMDMLPETNERKKESINNKNYLTYINNEAYKYEYQYMRNMLHFNNGLNDSVKFSEIGQMSGIFQTEWSWSALFADCDNDGFKDLLITNGFPKDITDKDFVSFRSDVGAYLSNSSLADSVPVVQIPNYVYRNNGDLTFTDVSKEWGFSQPSFSNGAAFADLDNDGDLDYIVNNINQEAFVFKNNLYDRKDNKSVHYLRVQLNGPDQNRQAIGSKVTIYFDGVMQYHDHSVARGYLSSVENTIHFGLGKIVSVDSIVVSWKNGEYQKVSGVKADQTVTITYDPALVYTTKQQGQQAGPENKLASDVTDKIKFSFKHEEEDKIDYNLQRTLPHKFSQLGPSATAGDINGDGLDDLIIGGSSNYSSLIFTQQKDGTFGRGIEVTPGGKVEEDEGMLLFDADNDGDLDLYMVSGSVENDPMMKSDAYQDRLYLNDGNGVFAYDSLSLPNLKASGSCVRGADFDGDGDIDLFVGGRVVPGSYPYPAESYILVNENGKFVNATSTLCPELSTLGMITDAIFSDFNNDNKVDLMVVGEFMAITPFFNTGSGFKKVENSGIEKYTGWWNSIVAGDFDEDGDIDYVAGNLGLNNSYQVTEEHPLMVYAKDFDKNGSVDAILACYIMESLTKKSKRLFPIHFWDEISAQSPRFRKQFAHYKDYGSCSIDELLTKDDLEGALILSANHFQTSYVENLGNGKFKLTAMPLRAQVSPVNGMVVEDVNQDGKLDVLMTGNDFGNEVFSGRLDASTGQVLLGNGNGTFELSDSRNSGFLIPGDTKAMVTFVRSGNTRSVLVTRNRDTGKVFDLVRVDAPFTLQLKPLDRWAKFIYKDNRERRVEFYYGNGYLSQSSRMISIPHDVKTVIIHSYDGKAYSIKMADVI